MATDIGAKLKVEGESSYSRAMREAAKNTKSLDSELKLAQAQFRATGDAQTLMTERGRILKEQLSQQERAVKTAQEMLEKLAQAGYDSNSQKVLEWRAKLAQAQEQVLNINGAINNNLQGLDETGRAYEAAGQSMQQLGQDANTLQTDLDKTGQEAGDLREALEKIGIRLGWEGVAETLHGINESINKTIKRAVELGRALWDAGVDATVWADDLITTATQMSIDQETLQRWNYAARFVDTSAETVAKAQNKITMGLGKSGKASEEWLATMATMGVRIRDENGNLRTTNDIFWDTIDYLSTLDNETQREAAAMSMLGRSADELNPLIEAGRDAWEGYANAAPIVSKEKVASLGAANDAIEDMNAHLETLKLETLAELAPTIKEIAEAITSAAQSLRDYLASEEGQAAIKALSESINGLITDFTELDFGQLLKDAQGHLNGIIQGFADILADKDKIKTAFEIIGTGIVALKVAEAAANVGKLYANLKLLKELSAAGAAGSGARAVTDTATPAGVGNAAQKVVGKGGLLTGVLPQLGGAALFGSAVVATSQYFDSKYTDHVNEVAESTEEYAQSAEEAAGGVSQLADALRVLNELYTEEIGIEDALGQLDLETLRGIAPGAKIWEKLDTYGGVEGWMNSGEAVGAQAYYYAEDLINSLKTYIDANGGQVEGAMTETVNDALSGSMSQTERTAEIYGENTTIGYANGIAARADDAYKAAQTVADGVLAIIKTTMDIGSPSRVMRELGAFTGQGFALGIQDTGEAVARAARDMMDGMAVSPTIDNSRTIVPTVRNDNARLIEAIGQMRVQIDGQDAGRIMLPSIEGLMAEQEFSRRYDA